MDQASNITENETKDPPWFLYLLSLSWYLRFDTHRGLAWYIASLVAFVFAMLSKGAAVSLPLIQLLCCWWRRGLVSRAELIRALPYVVFAAFMAIIEVRFMSTNSVSTQVPYEGIAARLTWSGWIVWFYLGKALLPIGLSFCLSALER